MPRSTGRNQERYMRNPKATLKISHQNGFHPEDCGRGRELPLKILERSWLGIPVTMYEDNFEQRFGKGSDGTTGEGWRNFITEKVPNEDQQLNIPVGRLRNMGPATNLGLQTRRWPRGSTNYCSTSKEKKTNDLIGNGTILVRRWLQKFQLRPAWWGVPRNGFF